MQSGFIVGAISSVATAVLLLSPSAHALLFHAPGAECELYETGHAGTIGGQILNGVAPGTGTTNLSCPVVETASFNKTDARQVIVDTFLGGSSTNSVTVTACSNPYGGGSAHCGSSRSVSGKNTPNSVGLVYADLLPGWVNDPVTSIDYGYLAVSLVGVGTRLIGYEID
jgi:hypothetical protein